MLLINSSLSALVQMANYWAYIHLPAYLGSMIPKFSALKWKCKGHHLPVWLHTWWHVVDTPDFAILGLPSSSKLGIVQLNCAVQFAHRCRIPNSARKCTAEQEKGQHDLMNPWEAQHLSQKHLLKAQTNHHYIHSTHEKTSSSPMLTTLKVLVSSLGPSTSL